MYYPVKKYNYFKLVVLALAMLAWQSCEKFEYSPYEMRLSEDEKNINQRNIQKLETLHITRNTAFQFILIADSQGFYEENEQLVEHINRYHSDALFLLLGGDITDFGLLKEHKLIHHQLSKLKMPYIAVIGNHDAVNNGKALYKAMYGDFDFSFIVGNTKFILLNTNFLEFDGKAPDLVWLEAELKEGQKYDHIFVLSHIYPILYEFGRDQGKGEQYGALISKYNVSYSLHGHRHAYNLFYSFDGRIPYLVSGATERLEYIVFTINGDNITFERIQLNS